MRPRSTRISRRRLLAFSGGTLAAGSTAALAACGNAEEDTGPSAEEEAAAVDAIVGAQARVEQAVKPLAKLAPERLAGLADALRAGTADSLVTLREAAGEQAGSAADDVPAAESPAEALDLTFDGAIAEIATAAGDLADDELRAAAYRLVVADAAAQALVRDALGEDPAPDAFVGAGAQ